MAVRTYSWPLKSRKGLLALVACFLALCIGLSVVHHMAMQAIAKDMNLMIRQHEETTASAVKHTTSYIISMVSAAFAVRYITEAGFLSSNRQPGAGPLSAVMGISSQRVKLVWSSVASKVYIPPPSYIATHAALSDENRSFYEQSLTRRCGAALGASSLQLASFADPAVGVQARNASGEYLRAQAAVYPIKSRYTVLSNMITEASNLPTLCSAVGTVIDESPARMKYLLRALATGSAAWMEPRPAMTVTPDVNMGFYLPVVVPTPDEAAPFGTLFGELLATAANASDHIRDACKDPARPCGRGDTTVVVLQAPVMPSLAVAHMLDSVPEADSATVTLMHIPFALTPLLQLRDGLEEWPAKTLRTMLASTEEIQGTTDDFYLNSSYFTEVTAPVQGGSLRPLLQQLDSSHVVFTGKRNPKGGVLFLNKETALRDAIAKDGPHDMGSMQCTHVFALGPHVYFMIIRHEGPWVRLGFTRQAPYTWTLGSVLTLLIAAVPLAVYWMNKRAESRHELQLGLMQAERDGVVQAVAFAAHEIRNPMHGVLASLESALEDAKPMYRFLLKAMEASEVSSPKSAIGVNEDLVVLSGALERCAGTGAVAAALNAFEDIAVAKSSAESCHRLVNDMVDYSKLQRGVMLLQRAPMQVRSSFSGLLASQRAFIKQGVHALFAAAQDVPQEIYTDELRLLQVITNGLTNASKFTQEGSVRLVLTVLQTTGVHGLQLPHNTSNEWLAITVIDSGKGLDGVDVDGLFEPVSNHRPTGEVSAFCLKNALRAGGQHISACAASVSECLRSASAWSAGNKQVLAETPMQSTPEPSPLASPVPMTAAAIAKSRGSGLGLPVARLMARALGGDCDLLSIQDAANPAKYNTAFLALLPFSALQKGSASPPQYPLFGRSGHLSTDCRASLRKLVQDSVNGTSNTPRNQPRLQYDNLSLQRRGSARSGLGEGRTASSFNKKVTELLSVTEHSSEGNTLATSATVQDAAVGIEPAGRRTSLPAPSALRSVAVPSISARPYNVSFSDPKVSFSDPKVSFSDPKDSRMSPVTNSAVASTYGGSISIPSEHTPTTPSTVMPEAGSRTSSSGTPARSSGGRTPLLHGSSRGLSKVVPAPLQPETDVLIAVSKLAPGARAVTFNSRWFGSASTAAVQPAALCLGTSPTARGSHQDRQQRRSTSPRGALSPKSPLRAQLTSLHDLAEASARPGDAVAVDVMAGAVAPPRSAPARILYADDDATNRRLLARMMERLSIQAQQKKDKPAYELVCVSDGWEALVALYEAGHLSRGTMQQARSACQDGGDTRMDMPEEMDTVHNARPFDLVLLDIDMPRFSGDQVAGVLRTHGVVMPSAHNAMAAQVHTPVVAVTGRTVGFEILEQWMTDARRCDPGSQNCGFVRPVVELTDVALRPGFDAALGKPFKAEQLAALCDILLNGEKCSSQVF